MLNKRVVLVAFGLLLGSFQAHADFTPAAGSFIQNSPARRANDVLNIGSGTISGINVSTITFKDGTFQTTAGGGGGASILQVTGSGVQITSPTATINVDTQTITATAAGTTANLGIQASSVTLQGNTFNAANKLVQLDGSARLPAVNGSQLTNLPAGGVSVYPATATATFPYGVNASTAVLQGTGGSGTNSKLIQGFFPLPRSGGFGPQPQPIILYGQGNTSSGLAGAFELVASTVAPSATFPDQSSSGQYASLSLNPLASVSMGISPFNTTLSVDANAVYVAGSSLSVNGVGYAWPASDGTNNQVLSTNGSEILSWVTPAGSSNQVSLSTGVTGILPDSRKNMTSLSTGTVGSLPTNSLSGQVSLSTQVTGSLPTNSLTGQISLSTQTTGNYVAITTTNASMKGGTTGSSGASLTLSVDPSSGTLQGNSFNGATQLVQTNGSSQFPALSGVNITNLNASNLASGTLADSRKNMTSLSSGTVGLLPIASINQTTITFSGTLVAGANITFAQGTSSLTITATSSGGGGSLVSPSTGIIAGTLASNVIVSSVAAGAVGAQQLTTAEKTTALTFMVSSGTAVIGTGDKGGFWLPFPCVISTWTVSSTVSGSVSVDISTCSYANYPSYTSIVSGGTKPALSSAQKNRAAPASWSSTTLNKDDFIDFNINSVTTLTNVVISLEVQKSQ